MLVWSVLFSLGVVVFGAIPPARGSGTDMEPAVERIFKVPPARGSGRDMESPGLAFSKCRPRVVVDRTWSRSASHFPSAVRAW